ncbi:MAG: thiol peroxidase [Leptospiraceae bacterium]|nr:thiol peroxidase [Leptospiraceae bacterium]MCP5495806.1 thiol peroxidase [Leptospiraceae bacterium]
MAQITFKGNKIHTSGELPMVGEEAPDFLLTGSDLQDVSISKYKGKKIILNIFPSIDTGVCATSVRKFNSEASKLSNTIVLCISTDMPFAHSRFCGAEGLKDVVTLSELRNRDFGAKYGLRITDGPLAGVLARSVVVVDENGKVTYTELVPEIAQEPDYAKALEHVK